MLSNWLKTTVLMACIIALFGVVGGAVGGEKGMLVALVLGGVVNFFAYWYSDAMVLRMYDAREVDATTSPYLYDMVKTLAGRAGLPMPRVYVIEEDQPNAFATGRGPGHAALAATSGILRTLSERELRGVMAHELAHVKHRDILISTIAATVAGAVAYLARFGFLLGGRGGNDRSHPAARLLILIFAPLAAVLIRMAIGRTREFGADRGGAEISGDPGALADALEKIENHVRRVTLRTAEKHPATAQMMIMNPLSGGSLRGLFSTHPPTWERVARLRAMCRGTGS
jgi:heat shock protein HtpX